MPKTDPEKLAFLQEDLYSLDIEDLLKKFNSFSYGLTDKEVEEKLRIYGLNEIAKEKKKSI